MSGMIVGGWEYVWGAYGLTAVVLVVYAGILTVRLNRARAERRNP